MAESHPKKLLFDYIMKKFNTSCIYKLDSYPNSMWKPSIIIDEKIYTTYKLYQTKKEATENFSEELYNQWTNKAVFSTMFMEKINNTDDIEQILDENTLNVKVYSLDETLQCIVQVPNTPTGFIDLHNQYPYTYWVVQDP